MKIYGFLKDLQGYCIPELIGHGLFATEQQPHHRILVMEHAGRSVTAQDLREPGVLQEIFDKLAQIHAHNVVLADLKGAHLCRHEKKGIMFIDFDLSVETTTQMYSGNLPEVRGDGVSYPNKAATGEFFGTPAFASIDLHLGLRPSPRCDFESLYYLVCSLFEDSSLSMWWEEGYSSAILVNKVEHIMKRPQLLAAIVENDRERLRLLIEAECLRHAKPLKIKVTGRNSSDNADSSNSGSSSCGSGSDGSPQTSSLPLPTPPPLVAAGEFEEKQQQLLDKFRSTCQGLLLSEHDEVAMAKLALQQGEDCIALDVGRELGAQQERHEMETDYGHECLKSTRLGNVSKDDDDDDGHEGKTEEKGRSELIHMFSLEKLCQKSKSDMHALSLPSTLTCALPDARIAVGIIQACWGDNDLANAVKIGLGRLEAALLIASANRTPKANDGSGGGGGCSPHPLSVLTLGMQGVVSVTSVKVLESSDIDQITGYLQDNRTWFPRVWLLAVAKRFMIHKSDSPYKHQVLEIGKQLASYQRSQPARVRRSSAEAVLLARVLARVNAIYIHYRDRMGVERATKFLDWLVVKVRSTTTFTEQEFLLRPFEMLMAPGREEEFLGYVTATTGALLTTFSMKPQTNEVKADDPLFVFLRTRFPTVPLANVQDCVRTLNAEWVFRLSDLEPWSEDCLKELPIPKPVYRALREYISSPHSN